MDWLNDNVTFWTRLYYLSRQIISKSEKVILEICLSKVIVSVWLLSMFFIDLYIPLLIVVKRSKFTVKNDIDIDGKYWESIKIEIKRLYRKFSNKKCNLSYLIQSLNIILSSKIQLSNTLKDQNYPLILLLKHQIFILYW